MKQLVQCSGIVSERAIYGGRGFGIGSVAPFWYTKQRQCYRRLVWYSSPGVEPPEVYCRTHSVPKVTHEPDWFRYLECPTCKEVEGQPEDEQRSHFGSFIFHPDLLPSLGGTFTCIKCGTIAIEEIEDHSLDEQIA